MENRVAILAGGLGTRMPKKYKNTIKPMIRFNGIPFICYQISVLEKNGFKDIVICSGNKHKLLTDFFEEYEVKHNFTKRLSVNLHISYDGDKLLGTGGAIKKALPLLGDNFLVLYGDSYLDFDYQKSQRYFFRSGKQSLMTLYYNNNKYDKSNVFYLFNKIISYTKEKNTSPFYKYIDYGANFFKKEAFYNMPDAFDLSDLQRALLKKNQLAGMVIKNRFYEIGSGKGINDFQKAVQEGRCFQKFL